MYEGLIYEDELDETPLEPSVRSSKSSRGIENLYSMAFNSMEQGRHLVAVAFWKRIEMKLENVSSNGIAPDPMDILVTLHNLACSYQKLEDIEKCNAYLDAVAFHAPNFKLQHTKVQELLTQLKFSKYHTKTNLQLCVTSSQLGKHEAALERARKAYELSVFNLHATLLGFKLHFLQYSSLKKRKAAIPDSLKHRHGIGKKAVLIIKKVLDYLNGGKLPDSIMQEMRSSLGVRALDDWVHTFAICDIMFIQPLTFEQVHQIPTLQAEFGRDYLLFKIVLLALSMFCIATEMKYLKSKVLNPEQGLES